MAARHLGSVAATHSKASFTDSSGAPVCAAARLRLRELAAAGLCQRVYGGALPVSPAIADCATRQDVALDSKRRVAAPAAALTTPGSTAILDGRTTTLGRAPAAS